MKRALKRAGIAVKQFVMSFSGRASTWWSVGLGRTRFDYASQVGDGRGNAIVQACVLWLVRTFPEAPLRVQRIDREGSLQPAPDHPMALLIHRPNPYYSGVLLWMATLADWTLSGNAYWLKVRSGAGRVIELWWVPSTLIEPKWPDDGSQYISHYEYRTGNGVPIDVPPEDVVHFRYGFDSNNIRNGLSPLASLLREIFTDDEASNFTAALLKNLGVPGVVISPGDDYEPDKDAAEQIKAEFRQRFGGDNRGEPMVMTGKTKVDVLSFSPEQMNLKDLRRIPEERVSAVFGTPAVVVGLGAGLDRSTFANYAEAREAAYESNIIPTQRLLAEEIHTQLLPDFGEPAQFVVDFDLSAVRVLQADQNELHVRAREDWKAGLLTRARALQMLGLESAPEDDVYLIPTTATIVPVGELPQPAQPPSEPVTRARRKAHSKAAEDELPVAIGRVRQRLETPLTADMQRFLEAQAERVVSRLGGKSKGRKLHQPDHNPTPEELLPADAEQRLLKEVIEPWYLRTLIAVNELAQDALGLSFDLDDPLTRQYLAQAGEYVGTIHTTTLDAVREALQAGQAEGEGLGQLAKRIRALGEFGRERAMTIARSELARASNLAALASYRASGVVVGVVVFDGEDFDEACQAMNGRRFRLDEAPPVMEHPRCRRAFGPITDAAMLEGRAA